MAITLRTIGNDSIQNTSDLTRIVKEVFADLEDQLNERAQFYVSTNGVVPAGLQRNDVLLISYKGVISILVKNSKGLDTLTADMLGGLSKNGTAFLGHKTATVAPTVTTDFPQAEQWGFYTNSTTPATFLCLNVAGVLKKIALT